MTINAALLSSDSDDWETPADFFNLLDRIFHFKLDACASAHNMKCETHFTKEEDGLSQAWHTHKRVWLNPPYGRGIERWMEKAYRESLNGCIVVCVVPHRSDTTWWHDWVKNKALVTPVRKRLKFRNPIKCPDGSGNSVFPSAVVIYGLDIDAIINSQSTVHIGRGPGAWPVS